MSTTPLVSILINNYNYANYVPNAISTALGQSYDRIEVIVVDDGSRDESRDVISGFSDRVKAVFKQNGGQGSAFNAGFAASQGDIICFLDADDYCAPNKIAQVVKQFQERPEAGWLFHQLQRVDAEGTPLASHSLDLEDSFVDFRDPILRGQPVRALMPATSGLCFRRDVLTKTLPMPEQLRISADNYLRLSAISRYPGILSSEKLAFHRIHGANNYEAKNNTSYLHGETNIQTSYYLRKLFPETGAFTEQLFSHSLGQLVGHRELAKVRQIPELASYLKEYFSLQTWLRNSPRILVNIAKASLST